MAKNYSLSASECQHRYYLRNKDKILAKQKKRKKRSNSGTFFRFCRRCDDRFRPAEKETFICSKCSRRFSGRKKK